MVAGLWVNDESDSPVVQIFGILLAASGFFFFLIGIVRFIKWDWVG